MATIRVSLAELPGRLRKDMLARERRIKASLLKVAQATALEAKALVPIAFGELEKSIHAFRTADGAKVLADAPHAAPVEAGSRPHWPPLEPLIRWCRLKGLEPAEKVARAVQVAISRRGTRPHHFMLGSLPVAYAELDRAIKAALPDEE